MRIVSEIQTMLKPNPSCVASPVTLIGGNGTSALQYAGMVSSGTSVVRLQYRVAWSRRVQREPLMGALSMHCSEMLTTASKLQAEVLLPSLSLVVVNCLLDVCPRETRDAMLFHQTSAEPQRYSHASRPEASTEALLLQARQTGRRPGLPLRLAGPAHLKRSPNRPIW